MERFMILRKYAKTDCAELAELFYDTVHTVNVKDYTREQQVERRGELLTNFVMRKERCI